MIVRGIMKRKEIQNQNLEYASTHGLKVALAKKTNKERWADRRRIQTLFFL